MVASTIASFGGAGGANAAADGSELKVVWKFPTRDATGVAGLPAIGEDGAVYLTSSDGLLHALNSDGSKRWSRDESGIARVGRPTTGASRDVAINHHGTIYAAIGGGLSAFEPDGSLKWRIPPASDGDVSSPAIAQTGEIYFHRGDHLCAVNPDGTVKWERRTNGRPEFATVIGKDGTVYASGYKRGSLISRVNAFGPDGTPKWTFQTKAVIRASPALGEDDSLYFGGFDANLYALDVNGHLKWAFKTGGESVGATPAVDEGQIYFGSGNSLRAIGSDGELRWRFQTNGLVVSSPAITSNGDVCFTSNDGTFYRVSRGGELQHALDLGEAIAGSPLISSDGTIYIRDARSLKALRGRPIGPSTGSWPMRRQNSHGTGCRLAK